MDKFIFKNFILSRLKEPSTWRGLVMFVSGVLGYQLSPELSSALASIGISISGLIGLFTPDNIAKK